MLRYNWKKYNLELWVGFILLIGTILRVYGFPDLPFYHDELSSWYRVQFSSIHEVINQGVAQDTHPALIQVFLYYYTGAFGDEVWVVKLPFILMSIASLYLFYKIALNVFNERNALLTLAVFCASQLIVVYSTISRPYASGLFLSLLAVKFWLPIIHQDRSLKNYLFLAVLLALLAYNHYFSGLFAILLWISTWFYFKHIDLKNYLLTTVIGAVLFLPHINITLQQMAMGGIGGEDGWLNAPDAHFIVNFFLDTLNYSYLIILVIGIVFLYNSFQKINVNGILKLRIIFCGWFIVSFAIGYFYSTEVNPVIQSSVLIFTFPFFLMGILGRLKGPLLFYKIASLTIVLIMSYELIFNRHHFEVINKQPFETISQTLMGLKPEKEVFAFVNHRHTYLNYYLKDRKLQYTYINNWSKDYSISSVVDSLFKSSASTFYTDGSNGIINTLSRVKYPVIVNWQDGYTFTGYTLKKTGTPLVNIETLFSTVKDTSFSHEFLNIHKIEFSDTDINFGNYISVTLSFANKLPDEVLLVFELKRGDNLINWSASNSTVESVNYKGKTWMALERCLWDNFSNNADLHGAVLNIFLWNRYQQEINLNSCDVELLPANPNYYGLFGRRPD